MHRYTIAALMLLALLGAAAAEDFKREGKRDAKDKLEGKAPPALVVKQWTNTNGKEFTFESAKGKVIVIDFWGTWCGPCRAAMPHLKELLAKHQKAGLVIIGIHTTNGGENMAAFVKEQGLTWPMAIDVDKKTVAAYGADSFPDYYIIDRAGNLRVADLANGDLDRTIETLLKEKAPVAAK